MPQKYLKSEIRKDLFDNLGNFSFMEEDHSITNSNAEGWRKNLIAQNGNNLIRRAVENLIRTKFRKFN